MCYFSSILRKSFKLGEELATLFPNGFPLNAKARALNNWQERTHSNNRTDLCDDYYLNFMAAKSPAYSFADV